MTMAATITEPAGGRESIETAEVSPEEDRRGAPRGKRNSIRSGTHSLAIGRYPKGGTHVARLVHAMRRQVEAEVIKRDGSIGVYQAAVINTAATHEGRALLLTRWLRVEFDRLSVLERANLLERIGTARQKRDECLRLLKLDVVQKADPWAEFDAAQSARQSTLIVAPDSTPVRTARNAADGQPATEDGH
jgi:hypothetical protein